MNILSCEFCSGPHIIGDDRDACAIHLKQQVTDLQAALSGRTVSCGNCETLSKQVAELTRELENESRVSEQHAQDAINLADQVNRMAKERDVAEAQCKEFQAQAKAAGDRVDEVETKIEQMKKDVAWTQELEAKLKVAEAAQAALVDAFADVPIDGYPGNHRNIECCTCKICFALSSASPRAQKILAVVEAARPFTAPDYNAYPDIESESWQRLVDALAALDAAPEVKSDAK